MAVDRVDQVQPHVAAGRKSRDRCVIQTPPMPVVTNASGLPLLGFSRSDDVERPDAVPVDSAAGHHQQSHVAASSDSQVRGVIQSPQLRLSPRMVCL